MVKAIRADHGNPSAFASSYGATGPPSHPSYGATSPNPTCRGVVIRQTTRMPVRRIHLVALVLWFGASPFLGGSGQSAEPDAEAQKTALAVETLTRLQSTDLSINPKLKEAVFRVLERTRGTPNFVKLVRHFQIPNQETGLLEVVLAQPMAESAEAMRLLLAGDVAPLQQALTGTNVSVVLKVVETLGNAGEKQANPLLLAIVTDAKKDAAVRRQAVRSLVKTADGAREVLRLAKDDQLALDLRFTAANALSLVRWEEIKKEAATVLPPAQGQNAVPLPPLDKLLAMKGDPHNGARIFTNTIPGCSACHVVHGQGTELGPNLSEVGTKLGKDALYEAILEPSAGISFGFEAFNVTLKSGDEYYGLIASESADELTLKAVGGITTRIKKSDITSRQQSKVSLMPTGLQVGLTTQELVDLIEYLASLKKP